MFAIQSGITGSRAKFPTAPDGDFTEGKGRLAIRNGRRFLHLEGSPGEMGYQHGRLLGPLIATLLEEYLRGIRFWRRLTRDELLKRARAFEPFIPPQYVEEIRAVGEGAGLSYEDMLVAHTFLESCQVVQCSCFAAWGRTTRDGGLVFGRSLDFMSMGFAHRAGIIAFMKPEKGIPFISVGWPGWCGTLTAVNVEGLCVGPLNVPHLGRTEGGMPYVIMFREVAQSAATCDEAFAILQRTVRTYPNNVLLAQTHPRPLGIAVEYTAKAIVRREPRSDEDFILSTNHFRRLGHAAELAGSGGERYDTMRRILMERRGEVTLRTSILSDPRVCLCNNLHSLVAEPDDCTLRVAQGRRPAALGSFCSVSYDESGLHISASADNAGAG
jgi:hypothetical protein